jgi:hypothetical protein
MATAYPGAIDNFTNPTSSDTLNSVTVPHATQHSDLNDAVEAIETALGTNPEGGAADVSARIGALETTVDTASTGLVDRVDALETTVDTATTGLVDRVEELEEIGLSPLGGDLALNIAQVTADAADELVAGTDPGEVDDTDPVTWFKFTIDSVEYAVPAYAIVPTP